MNIKMTILALWYMVGLWLRDTMGELWALCYRWRLTRRPAEFIAAWILMRMAHSRIRALDDKQNRGANENALRDSLYDLYLKLDKILAGRMPFDDIADVTGPQYSLTREETVAIYLRMKEIEEEEGME